ncbi:MAG: DNA replication/repair protein RecF [Oscillospiraceae bacterium]
MKIQSVHIDGFRNLSGIEFSAGERLNVIWGENAQGKTNLLEALWLCTGAQSFRRNRDYVGMEREIAAVTMRFSDRQRTQEIVLRMGKTGGRDRLVTLNGVKKRTPSGLFGSFSCVVFTPEDLELAKGSPESRRVFLDLCIAQIKLSYARVTAKYEGLLAQRNALLKTIAAGGAKAVDLEVWDVQLARMGAYISVLRHAFVKKLGLFAGRLYSDLSGGKEVLTLSYHSTVFETLEGRGDFAGELAQEYLAALRSSHSEDIRAGFTSAGVHRDDLVAELGGLSVREFGSQGQKRSVSLVYKLAQAFILHEESGEAPVLLLDDVLSELDRARQEFVLSRITPMQVFLTCCERNFSQVCGLGGATAQGETGLIAGASYFLMQNGRIVEKTTNEL